MGNFYGSYWKSKISIIKEISSHTQSDYFIQLTYYTGFKVNSGEYKVMGLAPYGQQNMSSNFKRTNRCKRDGSQIKYEIFNLQLD